MDNQKRFLKKQELLFKKTQTLMITFYCPFCEKDIYYNNIVFDITTFLICPYCCDAQNLKIKTIDLFTSSIQTKCEAPIN